MAIKMKIEISYADSVYKKAQKWNYKSALWLGKFDQAIMYGENDINEEFRKANKEIFQSRRGGGYWIWKPYLILKAMKGMQIGDYLFYCDAGAVFIRSVDKLIQTMERNNDSIMLYEVYGRLEKEWTKRDIFKYLDNDTEACANSNQIMGSFILAKKTDETMKFFEELLEKVQYKELITDSPNILGGDNYDGFQDNRHDQSFLSVLAKKHGLTTYRDPSQWGAYQKIQYRNKRMNTESDYRVYERSKYPTVIWLHRYKMVTVKNILCSIRDFVKNYWKMMRQ